MYSHERGPDSYSRLHIFTLRQHTTWQILTFAMCNGVHIYILTTFASNSTIHSECELDG